MNALCNIKKLIFILLLCLAGLSHAAIEVAGVTFPDKVSLGNSELQLNGAGMRAKFFLRVYAIGLYLGETKNNANDALALTGPKRLQIVTLRDLTAEQFADALVEGIRRNHSEAELESLLSRIETFKAAMLAIKTTPKGTVITIDWLPGHGTHLSIDGQRKSGDIAGEDFFSAVLNIWLGQKPAQGDLKDALLGKPQ